MRQHVQLLVLHIARLEPELSPVLRLEQRDDHGQAAVHVVAVAVRVRAKVHHGGDAAERTPEGGENGFVKREFLHIIS